MKVKLTLLVISSILSFHCFSQTVVSTTTTNATYWSSDPSAIVFGIRNTNPYSILITDISNYMPANTTTNFSLWYHPSAVTGAPSDINTSNGWIEVSAGNTVTSGASAGITPVLTGISLIIPSNTTYRLALAALNGGGPYYGASGASANLFSGGGLEIYAQNNAASATYVGYFPDNISNTPRSFYGSISFIQALNCVGPPNPGTISGISGVCSGQSTILSVTGQTAATGLTYQWLSSSGGGPYTPISGATGVSYTTPALTANTSYAVTVSCGASNSTTAPFTVSVSQPLPGGTYTIDGSQPNSATNFQTFADVEFALSCGIAGPIVFEIAAGFYDEQVSLPVISGSSAVNTVTFDGNGTATLRYAPTSSARYLFQLNGTDYITIRDLNLLVQSGNNYGWGFHLTNGADHNTINNCSIDVSVVTSTSQSNSGGIVISGAETSVTTDGSASNNTFSNNTITGAYQGIIISGSTGSANAVNNQIINNTIRDFYTTGIEISQTDGVLITNNNISRANRAAVTLFTGIDFTGGNIRALVSANRIHSTHTIATDQTDAAYGIYLDGNDAPAGSENSIINNLIYNFNSTNGTQYGLYNTGSNGVRYYHNTIVLNDPSTVSNDVTRGFYQTTSANNIEFRNNIVYISRGGTGEKHALFFNTTGSSILSNNNVLYVNTTNAFTGAYGTTDYATLTAWQAANSSAYDQQSLSVDPVFADAVNGNFYPINSTIASAGANVGVNSDIIGTVRDATPTPGSYETVATVGTDVGAVDLLVPAQQNCYSNAETVTVVIRNFSSTSIDFSTTPVTVNVSVTGPNAISFTPVTINSGTLAPDATLNVIISSNYNMTAAGTYVFNASTSTAGDANALNDAMPAAQRMVTALEAGTASSDPASFCATGGIPVLSLSGSSGGNIQWQESLTGAAGSWINTGTNSISYSPAVPNTVTTYYRAYVSCAGSGDTSNVVTVLFSNPQLLSTTPATRCGPGTVVLSATGSPGTTLNWYTSATGGSPVGTGNNFTTPVISTNTTYYVSAAEGGASSDVGISPTSTTCGTINSSTATDWPMRFNTTAPITINSAWVIPNSTSLTVALRQALSTANIQTAVFTFTSAQVGVPQQINLGFAIPASGSYQLTNSSGNIYRIGTFTCSYPFTSALNGFSIVGSATSSTAATNTTTYNAFFQLNISEGCESARTSVLATIVPSPAFDITNSTTVCNNTVTTLQVNSSLADYNNFTWLPVTGLYSDPGATIPYTGGSTSIVFAKTSTAGTYTYIATANNTVTNCQNIDSLHLTVLPATITLSALPQEICVSGTTTLSYSPNTGLGAATTQWYSSADGISYNLIAGATGITYVTPVLTTTSHYKLELKDAAGNICQQPAITININNPQVLTSAGAARCGDGTLTLNATSTTGAALNWYTAATGGLPVGTGTAFTTPVLNTTTTYYVGAIQGGGSSVVGLAPDATGCGSINSSSATDWPMRISTSGPVRVDSVWVIPTGTELTLALRESGSTTNLQTASFTFTSAQVGTPQQLGLGWAIPLSGNYQMTNASGGISRIGTYTCSYPFVSAFGGFSIVGSATSSTASTSLTQYNAFFNIKITEGCESPRASVTATVSPNTAITSQPANQAVCTGSNVTFNVTAIGAGLTYQWRKNNTDIPNATGSSLVLNAVTSADAATYSVVITGLCGNATSNNAILTVADNNAWLGVVSVDWNTPANWCGGVPTSTSDVVITSGTPYAPVVNGIANVRNLTINNGTSLTVAASAFLNIYGNFSNGGTFSAPSGFVAFRGNANQNIGAITVGTVIMNGTGGITLTGNMSIENGLILTNGNITTGASTLSLNGSTSGSAASHIITNGTGVVISNNINAMPVVIPVGPDATSYNPVIISNGQGRNYQVRVATGITPAINNPNRAVNRTWYVVPNTVPASEVNLVFQFVETDMNTNATASLVMEAAVNNGSGWTIVSPPTGVTPSGTPNDRQVGVNTVLFGSFAIGNFGAISFPTATTNIDADVTSMVMMPNLVQNHSILRLHARRAMKINWSVVDANGRIVMSFTREAFAGRNDIHLQLGHLAQGSYQIVGSTTRGTTGVMRFIKM